MLRSIGRAPSLLLRLMLVIAVIGAVMVTLAAFALVDNAKRAIEVEVEAGRYLARDYVIAAIGSLMRTNSPEEAVSFLPTTLFQPRHVKITVVDRVNGVTHFPRPPKAADDGDSSAPDWFVDLLSPPVQEVLLPIRVGPDTFGTVLITTSPEDEVNEVWEDFRVLAFIGALTYAGTLLILAVVLRFALAPLSRIGNAFGALEEGDFSARIGHVGTPDFAPLAERFDRLADTVEQALAEKDALNRRLVKAQDDERRTIAMDLHDEFGPCLFGLNVEARAIWDTAKKSNDMGQAARAESLLSIVTQIQSTNRQLLARLRPMEIGQLPLSALIVDLVENMRPLAPELHWQLSVTDTFDASVDQAVELQIYRITQEAVTNALRHARPEQISIGLRTDPKGGGDMQLKIEDDGIGWSGMSGSGLSGMRERAESLGGNLRITNLDPSGTAITFDLPVVTARDGKQTGDTRHKITDCSGC